jgi:hypothetical protein
MFTMYTDLGPFSLCPELEDLNPLAALEDGGLLRAPRRVEGVGCRPLFPSVAALSGSQHQTSGGPGRDTDCLFLRSGLTLAMLDNLHLP